MAVDYNYEILSLRKKDIGDNKDTVYHVQWRITGTDDDTKLVGIHHGAFPMDATSGTFIKYEDLTETKVKGWVESKVLNDKTYWSHIQEKIQDEINRKKLEAGIPGGVIGDTHTTEGKIELPWSS